MSERPGSAGCEADFSRPGRGVLTFPSTRQQIADALGLTIGRQPPVHPAQEQGRD